MSHDTERKRALLLSLLGNSQKTTASKPSEIAIVGVNGRYPQADNLEQFWINLSTGKNCIQEVPENRWPWQAYANENSQDKSQIRAGFIDDADKFDPLFFGISPREADRMDPQERLFLECAWHTIEDAGYTPESLSAQSRRVGVFAGAMNANYSIYGSQQWEHNRSGNRVYACNPTFWSIANRVSYTFDFNGPSFTVDSACSSSLTAIHLACESIRRGECEVALAGGVNLILHPAQLDSLSKMNMLSKSGNCHTFGADADGFTDGEGVGTVLLKPLEQALADNDHVYGVVAASAINSGGKTSGYTVPNPNAQAALIESVIEQANINPENISYIEAHGTGTSLGDPIEVRGLTKAFQKYTQNRQFCAIGSVKSNIGHLESAAGISALTKVLLQFKHRQLAPSINSATVNPNIRFDNTPFYIQNTLSALSENKQHIAGISSFGAGGANAHLLIKSPRRAHSEATEQDLRPYLIFLSAQTNEQLKQSARNLSHYLKNHADDREVSLGNVAYTLTEGRVELGNRLAVVAFDLDDLIEKLEHFCANTAHRADIFFGEASEVISPEQTQYNSTNLDILNTLAQRWVKGEIERPTDIFKQGKIRRLPMPGYPFARERYWIQTQQAEKSLVPAQSTVSAVKADKPDLLYFSSKWSECTPSNKPEGTLTPCIFLTEKSIDIAQLDPDNRHTWLYPDGESSSRGIRVDTTTKQSFYKVLNEVLASHPKAPNIVYGWTSNTVHNNYRGLRALLWLSQYLLEKRLESQAKLVIWHSTSGTLEDLHGSAYAGFCKSLHVEKPQLSVKHVSFIGRNAQALPLENQYELLLQEIDGSTPERIVKFENGKRFVEKVALQTSVTDPGGNKPITRTQGTYLITGGAGGLGRIIAKQLAKQGNLNLILTGRTELDDDKKLLTEELRQLNNEAVYLACDVTDKYEVVNLLEKIVSRFGELNGIVHSAGVLNDCLVQNKQWQDFYKVVATKTQAVVNLDAASEGQPLDFFVTFSSISSMLGNIGQTDYAYANSFMDNFIQWRNNLEEIGERTGSGITINWPIWSDGGMQISPTILKAIEAQIGVLPLRTDLGIQSFTHILGSNVAQVAPVFGYADRIIQYLNSTGTADINPEAVKPSGLLCEPSMDSGDSRMAPPTQTTDPQANRYLQREALLDDLTVLTSKVLDITSERIHKDTVLGDFGFDSITLKEFSQQLKLNFGISLSPAIFFAKNTLNKLSEHILENHENEIVKKYAKLGTQDRIPDAHASTLSTPSHTSQPSPESHVASQNNNGDIAIIGASGIMPGAKDLDEFWENLVNGVDSITEIPDTRWRWQDHYGDSFGTTNKSNSKWGGFIENVDKFDYAFFDISHREANFMDPQQRLFLQTSWHAIENAGYDPMAFSGTNVGVFAGVEFNDYKDLLDQYGQYHAEMPIGNAHNMIPNRVSYFMDLHGPSEAIDTACSSSLVAINRAVRSIQSGESQLAIAGGISLTLSPKTMIGTSQLNIYSPDGHCKTLDASANGYVKGEGVGVLILKNLTQAIKDNDNILAVIKGCSVNHGGRSNSITAPNPDAQSELIFNAYHNANIDPERIAYIEMHGTGTNLGDPVEVEGIKSAFNKLAKSHSRDLTSVRCGIGSVKTNIGHLEPAAGIAGVLKMLLALQHRKLPPSLHFNSLNPLISLDDSPLYVVDKLQNLSSTNDQPSVVGVSSFGFGGSNAHIVLEQWQAHRSDVGSDTQSDLMLFPVSAKTQESLMLACSQLAEFATNGKNLPLERLAYTLQTGRTSFDIRMVCIARSKSELLDGLESYISGKVNTQCFSGDKRENAILLEDLQATDFHTHLLQKSDIRLLAKWWAKGLDINWKAHYADRRLVPLALPGYPFATTRCWLPNTVASNVITTRTAETTEIPIADTIPLQQQTVQKNTDSNRVSLHILDRVAELSGKSKSKINATDNLALDLGLDSIKMMGLINELIAMSSEESVRSFNKLGMNTIINKARTFGELVSIFSESEVSEKPSQIKQKTTKSPTSVDLLDSQSVFVPAHFLTKSSSLCSYVILDGELDTETANLAWRSLVNRHPALQLSFHWPIGSPATMDSLKSKFVKDCSQLEIRITDITHQSAVSQENSIEEFFNSKLNYQWDLEQWPLHRFDLVKCSDDRHVLFWSNEHIISDGLSNQIAIREFLEIYQSLIANTELPSPPIATRDEYIACVKRMNESVLNQDLDSASESSATKYLFNPEGSSKDIDNSRFANYCVKLDQRKTSDLKRVAALHRINLNTLLTHAFVNTLSRFDADAKTILLQIPTGGRSCDGVEVGEAIGCFAQNLTLEIDTSQPFKDQTEQIEQTLQTQLLAELDKQQTRALRTMIAAFPLSNNRSLPAHTLEMLLDNVKSNIYFPFTGDTGIANQYQNIVVKNYRAGTSNSPGAIDFLHELHNGELHMFVNYDASYFSAPLIQELTSYYLSCLEKLLTAAPATASKTPPHPENLLADNRCNQNLLQAVFQASEKRLSTGDFEKDLELDLGVDSLLKIRLIGQLQTLFDTKINKSGLARCRTLSEMSAVLQNLQPTNNASKTPVCGDSVPENLDINDLPVTRIVQQCLATPDATAVTHFNGESITYRELHENSNRIANLLIDRGVKNGDYVGLVTHRGPKMITSIVAILKCGAAYVPMDPIFPADRKSYILKHAKINTVLSESALAPQLIEINSNQNTQTTLGRILLLDDANTPDLDALETSHTEVYQKNDWSHYPSTLPQVSIHPEDDMVVLFTSGSTGNPKGVYLHHLGYANRILWHQKAFKLRPGEKVAQKTSCSFDVSIWEHLWPIMYGGVVCAVEKDTVTNPWEFAEWLISENIAIAHFVPSMFGEFVNAIAGENYQFPGLRWLIFSGEALPTATVQNWIDGFGLETGLCNLYGPTEASIDVTYHYITTRPHEDEAIPIGKAVDNTVLFIRGENGERLPAGEMGELIIAGKQLAKGYLYEPELTRKAFIPNVYPGVPGPVVYRTGDLSVEREDGTFEYHGRIDSQVKLRGFRVELGEIENVASSHPRLEEAAVLVVNDELTLWYSGHETEESEIKRFIGDKCPSYMIPQTFYHLERLPKNTNGKLDRKALLGLESTGTESDSPSATGHAVRNLPLAPAQRWVFSYFDSPYQWWGSSQQRLPADFDEELFNQALNLTIARHEALRTQFIEGDNGDFLQQIVSTPNKVHVENRQLNCSGDAFIQGINREIRAIAKTLQAQQWPLFRVVTFENNSNERQLVWVAHHLISDMLSGFIVDREIWQIYDALKTKQFNEANITPTLQTTDFIHALQDYFDKDRLASAKDYWQKYSKKRRSVVQIPVDFSLGENIESSSESVIRKIPTKLVHYLETDGRDYYDTSLYNMLGAALYKLVAQTTRRSWIVVSHKLNGRSLPSAESNFFTTIGNFAINVPVGISVQRTATFAQVIEQLQNEISDLPAMGLGYDWIAKELPAEIYPDHKLTSIRINYLGDISSKPDSEGISERVAPENQKRTSVLEFFFYSKNKEMFIEVSYSHNLYARETIDALTSRYLDQLTALSDEIVPELFHTN